MLVLEKVLDKDANVVLQYSYTLGAAGERTKVVETGADPASERTVEYAYDALYRLTSETVTDANGVSVTEYTYDSNSNRLTKTVDGEVTEYSYNELNQLVSETGIRYKYDKNGNLVKKTEGEQTTTYTYDARNKLIRATVQSGQQVSVEEYAYDFAGNRIAKIGEISATYYLVDTNGALSQVLAEYDENGTLTINYTRADELISQERNGAKSYYLYDGSDSVRMLANEDGEITDTYTFDTFGNLTASTGSTKNDFLYRGEQFDSFTGLYYLRARYMNPATGTFITMDEYAGSVFEPVSLHKYLYANANPVMYSDPSGYEAADINNLVVGMACMTILAATILPNLNNITDWLGSLQNDLQPNWVIGYDDVLGWSEGLGRGTSTPLTIGQNIIISSIDDSTDNADEKDEPWKKDDHGQVYYHATSFENAILILESGTLKGSSAEGGYVYAWKNYPNKNALKASGARDYEVIIAFETQMAFENDPAFYNEDETIYYKKMI